MEEVLSLMKLAADRKLEVLEIQVPKTAAREQSFMVGYMSIPGTLSTLMGYRFRFATQAALICK